MQDAINLESTALQWNDPPVLACFFVDSEFCFWDRLFDVVKGKLSGENSWLRLGFGSRQSWEADSKRILSVLLLFGPTNVAF